MFIEFDYLALAWDFGCNIHSNASGDCLQAPEDNLVLRMCFCATDTKGY